MPPRLGIPRDELFRLFVESVLDYAIILLDPDGLVSSWNLGAERIMGHSAGEIMGRHFSVFYPDAAVGAGACERDLDDAAREDRVEDEGWRLRKDGTRLWCHVAISAVRDPEDGRLVGFSHVTRDLTERRRAEETYQRLVESVRDYAIFLLDARGRIATWNPGAERIKGYTADEIIGRHFSAFYPKEDIAAGKCELELAVAARDGRFEDEGWRLRKDGSRFWANVVISAVRAPDGELVGFSKVTRDLTERRRVEEERAARLAAEEANRAKDEFLALLGHELRNPLAPIVTALQLMKLRSNGEPTREQDVIDRQVRHMVRLVDDLLDVARITRGKVDLDRQPTKLRDVLAKAIEIASPLLEQRRHHLAIDVGDDGDAVVDGDEARLAQVFSNLLTNAAKYTEPGGHIGIRVRGNPHEVTIDVSDDGIGIEAEMLPRVFDLFVQGFQRVDRSRGGLGLGLTLVRRLVELHGGAVGVHSEGPRRGATFSVSLPRLRADRDEAVQTQPLPQVALGIQPRRVLIVDDNQDALDLLAEALETAGHDVKTATDPAEALEVIKDFHPELAILDIGLPVMDGYELAAQIRAELADESPRMFALTGYGQEHDQEKSLRAGFDAHFVKPVELRRLLDRISVA